MQEKTLNFFLLFAAQMKKIIYLHQIVRQQNKMRMNFVSVQSIIQQVKKKRVNKKHQSVEVFFRQPLKLTNS